MASIVTMPSLGESVVEGTVGKWHAAIGQRVEKGSPLVEILTDKADSEVPVPVSGVITKLLASEGATVKVGGPLCEIDENATVGAAPGIPHAAAPERVPPPAKIPDLGTLAAPSPQQGASSGSASTTNVRATPSARRAAREHDIPIGSVASTDGSRVTRDDVMRQTLPQPREIQPRDQPLAPRPQGVTTAVGVPAPAPRPALPPPNGSAGVPGPSPILFTPTRALAFSVPAYQPKPGDEIVPFSRRRRIIADHMVYSKVTAPHVVTFAECDLHKTSKFRDAHKAALKAEGVNLTFLSFVAAAVARALVENRTLNARVLDDAYALIREVNLGIAVDTPEGLVVPVVKNASELTVRGLARGIDEVAKKARDNKLAPDDLAGKTFTISNPGLKGNLVGGAIISQPNVGILRMGEITKRVVVVEHEEEDLMAIHPVMFMALSYDHRIVDGVAANSFLYRVVEILEAADFVL